jgi:hypothetical protein
VGTLLERSSLRRGGKPQADGLCLGWESELEGNFLGIYLCQKAKLGEGGLYQEALVYILMLQVQGFFFFFLLFLGLTRTAEQGKTLPYLPA